MALVANPMPVDTMVVGMRVCYFDPTADMAGLKYGTIKTVTRGESGTDDVMELVVTPEVAGSDVTGAAAFFRVVDDIEGYPNV